METAYLETVVLVAEVGSMAEAARRLGLTPAAVAQQVRVLERHLGVPLLERSGRTMAMTEAGHKLVARGQSLLRELGDLKTSLAEATGGGELRLGAINTALHSMLPSVLAQFVKAFGRAQVYVRSGTTQELYEALERGEVDASVCLLPAFNLPKSMHWVQLRQEPLVVLAPARLAGRDPHELLRNAPLIRYDRRLGGGRQAERYLRQAGIHPQQRLELSSLLAIAMMVERDLGVSLVPDIASPLLDGLRVAKLALPRRSEARRFGVLWSRASPRARLIEGFVHAAKAVAAKP